MQFARRLARQGVTVGVPLEPGDGQTYETYVRARDSFDGDDYGLREYAEAIPGAAVLEVRALLVVIPAGPDVAIRDPVAVDLAVPLAGVPGDVPPAVEVR